MDMAKENTQIDLSIIIINWNTKDLLLACLGSLSQQQINYKTEIIVVDNASSDGSPEIVNKNYQHVKLIRNDMNLGFGKANNIGIKQSRGRYVCLLNSDVRVLPGCMESLINFMDQNKSIGISSPKILAPDMIMQSTCRKLPSLWNNICELLYLNKLFPKSEMFSSEHMDFFDHKTVRHVEGLAGCCLIIRKAALDQVGLFDERFFIYFEETDLCKRFRQAGWDIVFSPDAVVIHHHAASSSKDPVRFHIEFIKSQMQYWEKNHSKTAVIIFMFILLIHHGTRLILRSISYIFTAPAKRIQMTQQLSKHYLCLKLIITGKYGY